MLVNCWVSHHDAHSVFSQSLIFFLKHSVLLFRWGNKEMNHLSEKSIDFVYRMSLPWCCWNVGEFLGVIVMPVTFSHNSYFFSKHFVLPENFVWA